MRRLAAILAATAFGALLGGCSQSVDTLMSWSAGMDCKLERKDRNQPPCYPKDYRVAEAPLYCYKTIGGVECYGQPDRYADARAPLHPAALPVNTLALRDMPPGMVPGGPAAKPELTLANPDGRDGAAEAVRRETAALQAKIDAESTAIAVPIAPTLSEPLVEPPKAEPAKKPPPRRTARRSSTGAPTPITRPPTGAARLAAPPSDADSARPMTDAEGAALADRQNRQ
jgi:hypothetical protein